MGAFCSRRIDVDALLEMGVPMTLRQQLDGDVEVLHGRMERGTLHSILSCLVVEIDDLHSAFFGLLSGGHQVGAGVDQVRDGEQLGLELVLGQSGHEDLADAVLQLRKLVVGDQRQRCLLHFVMHEAKRFPLVLAIEHAVVTFLRSLAQEHEINFAALAAILVQRCVAFVATAAGAAVAGAIGVAGLVMQRVIIDDQSFLVAFAEVVADF
mmetsp:Transcript_16631/g.46571  ORF Transcript_16631/g.46571 Transcript_16631/m.46571 type:complete len:210 (+) Transcript_16631:1700-2329(+)